MRTGKTWRDFDIPTHAGGTIRLHIAGDKIRNRSETRSSIQGSSAPNRESSSIVIVAGCHWGGGTPCA
eukprot:2841295-Pyramimonas_sp.AAC.1